MGDLLLLLIAFCSGWIVNGIWGGAIVSRRVEQKLREIEAHRDRNQ